MSVTDPAIHPAGAASPSPAADADDPACIIALFNRTFRARENTVLVRGGGEPEYRPADGYHPYHRILFAHGFVASAFHEIAHWTIAGQRRRRLVDYGYWYQPDGRDASAQQAFEAVEVKPQAIEWAFTLAAGRRFHVSLDNLGDVPVDREAFAERVRQRFHRYHHDGFPPRAQRFIAVLRHHFGTRPELP